MPGVHKIGAAISGPKNSGDAMGGWKKEGGWKTSRMTPLPKRSFGPPLVRYVFHPPQASALCFSCTKIHDRADQKLFWRGPKIFGRARPPIRFAPPPFDGPKNYGRNFMDTTLFSEFFGNHLRIQKSPQKARNTRNPWMGQRCSLRAETPQITSLILGSCGPPTEYTRPFESRKYTPKYTSELKIQTKIQKNTKITHFRIFFVFWSVFSVLKCISACIFGSRRVLYSVWGPDDPNTNQGGGAL